MTGQQALGHDAEVPSTRAWGESTVSTSGRQNIGRNRPALARKGESYGESRLK